jgi:peptidoglycan/LPS O-acetylase OafA/YrhL
VLETRVLVAIGVVSYSVFLWHEPLIRSLTDAGVTFDGTKGFAANVLLVFAVTMLLAALTYRYVERPALLRKQRVREPEEVPREQVQAAP